ncbi:MAG: type II secretion system protein [Candidatus Pacebacteria bacterium]|nr:type II secretion system protein [Candidatus Paceibacterota bacterium]
MFTKKTFNLSRGFTLIELLVVMAIIAILSTLLILQFNVARGKSRDTKRIADISSLQAAVEQYYNDNGGEYPPAPLAYSDLQQFISTATLPTDPLSGDAYYYAVTTNHSKYALYTELEYNNPVIRSDYDINSSTYTGDTSAGNDNSNTAVSELCNNTNYTVTSKQCVYDVGQK